VKKLRVNEKIRAPEIRVIDEEGQVGVMTVDKALEIAREREVDLVEISPTATPPVCKLMDFGKYLYQLSKKAQDARKHQTRIHVKEVKFRPKIDEHDYNFKKNNVLRFLEQGDKVKATIMFRGREVVHASYGRRILERLKEDVGDRATIEAEPKQEGNNLSMVLSPRGH
jgi:translation initiation factor IF-3